MCAWCAPGRCACRAGCLRGRAGDDLLDGICVVNDQLHLVLGLPSSEGTRLKMAAEVELHPGDPRFVQRPQPGTGQLDVFGGYVTADQVLRLADLDKTRTGRGLEFALGRSVAGFTIAVLSFNIQDCSFGLVNRASFAVLHMYQTHDNSDVATCRMQWLACRNVRLSATLPPLMAVLLGVVW